MVRVDTTETIFFALAMKRAKVGQWVMNEPGGAARMWAGAETRLRTLACLNILLIQKWCQLANSANVIG